MQWPFGHSLWCGEAPLIGSVAAFALILPTDFRSDSAHSQQPAFLTCLTFRTEETLLDERVPALAFSCVSFPFNDDLGTPPTRRLHSWKKKCGACRI